MNILKLLDRLLARFEAWLVRSTLKAWEESVRLECEQNARERESVREYFDRHYPSPSGSTGWSRRE